MRFLLVVLESVSICLCYLSNFKVFCTRDRPLLLDFHFSLQLNKMPLCLCTALSLSVHQLMGILADSIPLLTTVNRAAIIMGESISSVWKDIESYALEKYKPLTPLSHNLFIYK